MLVVMRCRRVFLIVVGHPLRLLGMVMVPVPVIALRQQVVRNGPVRLQFPAAKRLRQRHLADANRLPIPLGEHRVRNARRREHGPKRETRSIQLPLTVNECKLKRTRRWRTCGEDRRPLRECSPTALWTLVGPRCPPASGPRQTAIGR